MTTMDRRCPNGHVVGADAAFCTSCGTSVAGSRRRCGSGHEVATWASYCPACGAPVDGAAGAPPWTIGFAAPPPVPAPYPPGATLPSPGARRGARRGVVVNLSADRVPTGRGALGVRDAAPCRHRVDRRLRARRPDVGARDRVVRREPGLALRGDVDRRHRPRRARPPADPRARRARSRARGRRDHPRRASASASPSACLAHAPDATRLAGYAPSTASPVGIALVEELLAPLRLVVLADRARRGTERLEGAKEAEVLLAARAHQPAAAPP